MNTDRHEPRERPEHEPAAGNGAETVTDAELVQYLDGELSPGTAESLSRRIAASIEATERLDTLRRRSTRVSALLADVTPDEEQVRGSAAAIRARLRRAGTRPRHWISLPVAARVAAAVVLLLGGALAVPTARAWIVERALDVAAAIGLRDPQASTPTATAPGAAVGITFPVDGDVFEIHLSGGDGVLIVRRAAGTVGTAEATDAPGTSFVVLPAALHIEGRAAPGATYEVSLPATVRSVGVRVADGPVTHHALPGEGEPLRIQLGSRAP